MGIYTIREQETVRKRGFGTRVMRPARTGSREQKFQAKRQTSSARYDCQRERNGIGVTKEGDSHGCYVWIEASNETP